MIIEPYDSIPALIHTGRSVLPSIYELRTTELLLCEGMQLAFHEIAAKSRFMSRRVCRLFSTEWKRTRSRPSLDSAKRPREWRGGVLTI